MRILRISDVPGAPTGGMSRAIHAGSAALRSLGHSVDLLFREDLDLRCPEKLRRFLAPLRIASLVHACRGRYDVVEVHEPLAASLLLRRRAAGVPVVTMSHGLEERAHTAMLAYRRAHGERPTLKQRYSPLTVVWQARLSVRRAAQTLCCSREDADYLKAQGVSRARPFANGVDEWFLTAEPGPTADPGSLLFLGSWLPRKGIREVAAAFPLLLRDEPDLRLTLAGTGCPEAQVRAAFPAWTQDRLIVTPAVRGDAALRALYQQHAVLWLPSVFEGMPLVMLEAAAVGLAILTTPICGMRDFVRNGETGRFVPVGSAEALAAATREVLQEEARRLGSAAREQAAGFTWQATARTLAAAYEAAADEYE